MGSVAIQLHQEDRAGPLIGLPIAGDPGETPYGTPVQRVSLGETTKSLDNFLKFLEVCACVCVCVCAFQGRNIHIEHSATARAEKQTRVHLSNKPVYISQRHTAVYVSDGSERHTGVSVRLPFV